MTNDQRRFAWNLDWNLLRTFMVIAEHRGITAAANHLGVKQPTVSAALQRLEASVGHRLVERGPRRFQLTASGQKLHQEATQIFGSVAQLPYSLGKTRDVLRGHLSIALASHVVSPHFDEVLSLFAAAHPAVTFSLEVHPSRDVVRMVQENRVFLGICLLEDVPDGLESRMLFREFFRLYCGDGHWAYGRDRLTADEWRRLETVSFPTETLEGPLRAVRVLRDRLGLTDPPRGVCSSLHELRRLILAGIGIGALPAHVAQTDVETGRLWPITGPEPPAAVEVKMLSLDLRRLSEAERGFLDMLNGYLDNTPENERSYGE